MGSRQRAWLLILLVAAICTAAVWCAFWWRGRAAAGPAAFFRRLPGRDAVVLYVDFQALRSSGVLQLLTGSKVAEEPEYQQFVRKTDFDYRQDLDAAMVAFAPGGKYFLLKGRFDWKSLKRYAEEQSGTCYNSVCRMNGSTSERHISFLPVHTSLMALAVSRDDSAALRMVEGGAAPEALPEFPAGPVWLSIPPAFFKAADGLPTGTRMFARGLDASESIMLSLSVAGKPYTIRLDALCRNEQEATALAAQLTRTTTMLREMIQREHHQPNPADLSGVLCSGSFRNEGRRVRGTWPIEQVFLQNLVAGGA